MKTFREQIAKILLERNNEIADDKLNEATTQAAETLMTYIQQWNAESRNHALCNMLERRQWQDGKLILDCNFNGKQYPKELPLKIAYERYQYGYQRHQVFPTFSFPDAVKRIPDNLKEDWAEEIKGLFSDINRHSISEIKIISLGKNVKSLGIGNPHTYVHWESQVSYYEQAQNAINSFVENREGWQYLTTANLQDKTRSKEVSKVIEDILASADAAIKPSCEAVKEQDRRLRIRQDATRARNNVIYLQEFFAKYDESSDCLNAVSDHINETETKSL